MKKRLNLSTMVTTIIVLFFMTNCKKDSAGPLNPLNCSTNAEKVTAAVTTFSQNPTNANCEKYKEAVRDFYKSCSTFYTGATKKDLDDFLAEPCDY